MARVNYYFLVDAIRDSYKGKKLLKKYIISNQINMQNDVVVLMPDCDLKCNIYTLLYLNLYAREFEEDKVIKDISYRNMNLLIITCDSNVAKWAPMLYKRNVTVNVIKRREAECILKHYAYRRTNFKLIIASLDEPNGRQCRSLINSGKATLDEIIALGVLGIKYQNYAKWGNLNLPDIIKNYIT